MERARVGAKENAKKKEKVTRFNFETMERAKAEAKARVRDKTNYVQRTEAETDANIIAKS